MSQYEHKEDRMLIIKAKSGDTLAYEYLVKKYQKQIYYLCQRMTGAHQSADDLSQETFIKAFFAISKFKEDMNFFTWIRKIAVNSTLNYLKVRKREKPLGENSEQIPGNPGSISQELPQDRVQRIQIERKFKASLQSLHSDQRSVFILKVYEGLSYKDIAQLLNIPFGTVMSRLNRARKKLKFIMADYIEGGSR
jgi:RNA polymerase sigma-70 factor (ECF subfamily)